MGKARTNIDIDDGLAGAALRRLVGPSLTREFLLGLERIGWQGDLDDLRSGQRDKS